MINERHLIEKILKGDLKSFRILVEKYQKLVGHIVFRMISNPHDQEEICQEVFIRVYQNLAGFMYHSKLSTWIGKIAFNLSINYIRKQKSQLYKDMNFITDTSDHKTEEYWESYYAESQSPADLLEQKERTSLLEDFINSLPSIYKLIVTMYHQEEMSYKEIAEILDMPEGTVKSYLFRARKLLKNRLTANFLIEEIV